MRKSLIVILGILLVGSLVAALTIEQPATVTVIPGKFYINSPINNNVYNYRMIPLNLSMSGKVEKFRYGYIDNGGEFVTLCRECDKYGFYNLEKKPFDDGFHELALLGIFETGIVIQKVNFTVDTKDPKIKKVSPEGGITNGKFGIVFQEANPKRLVLNYGDRKMNVDLNNCVKQRENVECNFYVNLTDFNHQKIEYWFNLTDILDKSVRSEKTEVLVDVTSPLINNINITTTGSRTLLKINVTEANFKELTLYDLNSGQTKELCGELKKGVCEKVLSFTKGQHNLLITATDKADNEATESVVLTI